MTGTALSLVRRYRASVIAAMLAVLGGAALITATGVMAESGLRSHLPAGRLAGADVIVLPPQSVRQDEDLPVALPERATVPRELVDQLSQLRDVDWAVGDLSFPAAAVGRDGHVVTVGDPRTAGHGWSSAALTGAEVSGIPPSGPDQVAVDTDAGVRPGEQILIIAAGLVAKYQVSAVVESGGAGLFFDDATAERLAGRDAGPRAGTVDLVALGAAAGTTPAAVAADVRHALAGTDLTVVIGHARGEALSPRLAADRLLLLVIAGSAGGVVMLLVAFLVAGAFSTLIGGQRRELALLRTVGATPRQIRQIAARQSMAVALPAACIGAPFGYVLAGWFATVLAGAGVIPDELTLIHSPLPVLAAVGLLVLIVRMAVWAALLRVSRVPAGEAATETRGGPRAPAPVRTRIGLLLVLAAMTLSVAPLLARSDETVAAVPTAGIIAAIGLALAGPDLIRGAALGLARRLPVRVSAPTWLAVANIRGQSHRMSMAVTTLAMAVTLVITYSFTQTTVTGAVAADLEAATRAQVAVTAPAVGGVPDSLVAEVRAQVGVEAAAALATTTVLWPHQDKADYKVDASPALILGPDAQSVLDLGIRAGSLDDLAGASVAVSAARARSRGVGIGDQVDLILGDGSPVSARVVATYGRDLGFGPVVLSRDLAAGHTTSGLADAILVRVADPGDALPALTLLAAGTPGVEIHDHMTISAASPHLWVNFVVLLVLLAYVLLGMVNKLIAVTRQRRGELVQLRLVGATGRQIRGMLRREAALVSVAALTAGVLLSAIPLLFLSIGYLGRPYPAGPVWLLPLTALVVSMVVWLTAEFPVRSIRPTADVVP